MACTHNFAATLASKPYLTLDGALATELEKRGCDLSSSSSSSAINNNNNNNNNNHNDDAGSSSDDSRTAGTAAISKLWSAQVLVDKPQLIQDVHADYFAAGADIAITASYQASVRGLRDAGFDAQRAAAVIRSSVVLAQQAREQMIAFAPDGSGNVSGNSSNSSSGSNVADINAFAATPATTASSLSSSSAAAAAHSASPLSSASVVTTHQQQQQQQPRFVAGSVGPYGAYLADGSEYHGNYELSVAQLVDFHRPRMQILLRDDDDGPGVDILACETVPSFTEVQALLVLLDELDAYAWISLTLRDGAHMSDGTALVEVASLLDASRRVVAFGVNCVPPELVVEALTEFGKVSRKPFVVYPNSGEGYDGVSKQWTGQASDSRSLEGMVAQWYSLGARMIGGCCRTSPSDTHIIKSTLSRITS